MRLVQQMATNQPTAGASEHGRRLLRCLHTFFLVTICACDWFSRWPPTSSRPAPLTTTAACSGDLLRHVGWLRRGDSQAAPPVFLSTLGARSYPSSSWCWHVLQIRAYNNEAASWRWLFTCWLAPQMRTSAACSGLLPHVPVTSSRWVRTLVRLQIFWSWLFTCWRL